LQVFMVVTAISSCSKGDVLPWKPAVPMPGMVPASVPSPLLDDHPLGMPPQP
jgi:hypothetical protein